MENITIHYQNKPIYPIVLSDSFDMIPQLTRRIGAEGRKVCIVSDSNVAPLYLDEVSRLFGTCCQVFHFVFPAGEANKNLETVNQLYEVLIRAHLERGDFLAALGGGVTGDLTGFAAATYLRGIRFVQIPTSLLAQVDSSIGGKTGVDFRSWKNMIGAFHQPSFVLSCSRSLLSLPDREYLSGLGEIVKHGLIRSDTYYQWLKNHREQILNRNLAVMTEMILQSDHIKQAVVENDPQEKGERAVLNFGHTIGHAIEKLEKFSKLHGECISIGCCAAAFLSMKRGMITEENYMDIVRTLESFRLPVKVCPRDYKAEDIVRTSKSDKKMDQGKIRFILLQGIGNAVIDHSVTDEEILSAAGSVICQEPVEAGR